MTEQLKQAAQQALDTLKELQGGCTDSDDGTVEAITVWCPEVIEALERALTLRPAAQAGEREAFEAWARPNGYDLRTNAILGHYSSLDTLRAWNGWQARASLPTQPAAQDTRTTADTLREIKAASCKDCAATGYTDPGEADSPDGPGRPAVVCSSCTGTGWRDGVHISDQRPAAQATPTQQAAVEPIKWWNGCDKSVPEALRFLANNPRPAGGSDRYNAEHLFQLAGEIERMARQPLFPHPAPGVPEGFVLVPMKEWEVHDLRARLRQEGVGLNVSVVQLKCVVEAVEARLTEMLAAAQAKGGEHG